MNNLLFSVEYANRLNREHREQAAKHRLLRQINAGGPRVIDNFALYAGRLVMAFALALRLR